MDTKVNSIVIEETSERNFYLAVLLTFSDLPLTLPLNGNRLGSFTPLQRSLGLTRLQISRSRFNLHVTPSLTSVVFGSRRGPYFTCFRTYPFRSVAFHPPVCRPFHVRYADRMGTFGIRFLVGVQTPVVVVGTDSRGSYTPTTVIKGKTEGSFQPVFRKDTLEIPLNKD